MEDEILSPEEREAGFSLREEEHLLHLLRWGEVVAVFSASGATARSIRKAIRHELEKNKRA